MSQSDFHSAISHGDVTTIRRLIDQGAADANGTMNITWGELNHKLPDQDASLTWNRLAYVRVPVLHAAIAHGRANVVELLLKKNSNVNATRTSGERPGEPPLVLALERRLFQVAEVLLRGGADVNLEGQNGQTPLQHCCCATHAHFIPTLLRYGAHIQGNEDASDTPLHLACSNDDVKSASILVEHGADVNACNNEGESPIFHTTPDIMRMLIANGADVNIQDNDAWTPLHSVFEDIEEFKILLSNKAAIEAETRDGDTALHRVVFLDDHDMVRLLLAHQNTRRGLNGMRSLLLKASAPSKNVLHLTKTKEMAQLLIEQCRREDGTLLAACRRMLFAKDEDGYAPESVNTVRYSKEKAEYLISFTKRTLASSSTLDAGHDDTVAVMLNPTLDAFQRTVAIEYMDFLCTVFSEIEELPELPHETLYMLLGYLSPADVMKRRDDEIGI